jgi:hypothetical protein
VLTRAPALCLQAGVPLSHGEHLLAGNILLGNILGGDHIFFQPRHVFELGESAGAALPAAVHAFLLPCTRPARPVTATSMPGALAACLSRATDVSQLTHFPRRLLAMPLMRGRGEKRSEFSFFLHNILAEVVMTNLY